MKGRPSQPRPGSAGRKSHVPNLPCKDNAVSVSRPPAVPSAVRPWGGHPARSARALSSPSPSPARVRLSRTQAGRTSWNFSARGTPACHRDPLSHGVTALVTPERPRALRSAGTGTGPRTWPVLPTPPPGWGGWDGSPAPGPEKPPGREGQCRCRGSGGPLFPQPEVVSERVCLCPQTVFTSRTA